MALPITILSASPNPFYPDGGGIQDTTTITFKLGGKCMVWVRVYTYNRRLVSTLASAARLDAGIHELVWDGMNGHGRRLPAGMYTVEVLARLGASYYISEYRIILMSHMTGYPGNPVYTPTGQQAEYPCVLFNRRSFGMPGGTPYLMWHDSPEPPALNPQINLASSFDGVNWVDEGTVTGLTSPSRCFVLYHPAFPGSRFKMWYRDSTVMDDISAIRYAESDDGIFWSNDQPVTQDSIMRLVSGDPGTWNPYTFGPRFVLYTPGAPNAGIYPENHSYAMYYNVSPDMEKQSTALAFSEDGLEWHAARNYPVLSGTDFGGEEQLDRQYAWDEYSVVLNSMARTPSGMWLALYSGGDDITGIHKGIGFAVSCTGLDWIKGSMSNPLMHIDDTAAWRSGKTFTPFMIADRDRFSGYGEAVRVKIWFSGAEEIVNVHPEEKSGIGLAFLTAEVTP